MRCSYKQPKSSKQKFKIVDKGVGDVDELKDEIQEEDKCDSELLTKWKGNLINGESPLGGIIEVYGDNFPIFDNTFLLLFIDYFSQKHEDAIELLLKLMMRQENSLKLAQLGIFEELFNEIPNSFNVLLNIISQGKFQTVLYFLNMGGLDYFIEFSSIPDLQPTISHILYLLSEQSYPYFCTQSSRNPNFMFVIYENLLNSDNYETLSFIVKSIKTMIRKYKGDASNVIGPLFLDKFEYLSQFQDLIPLIFDCLITLLEHLEISNLDPFLKIAYENLDFNNEQSSNVILHFIENVWINDPNFETNYFVFVDKIFEFLEKANFASKTCAMLLLIKISKNCSAEFQEALLEKGQLNAFITFLSVPNDNVLMQTLISIENVINFLLLNSYMDKYSSQIMELQETLPGLHEHSNPDIVGEVEKLMSILLKEE